MLCKRIKIEVFSVCASSFEELLEGTKTILNRFDQEYSEAIFHKYNGVLDFDKLRKVAILSDDIDIPLKFKDNLNLLEQDLVYSRKVVFMFGGQGTQYKNMLLDYYKSLPFFKKVVDECLEKIKNEKLLDEVKGYLFKINFEEKELSSQAIQLVIFIVEYALAKLLIDIKIIPAAVIGYSLGEYVAAAVSEIYSISDILDILQKRGELIENSIPGKMLSVPLSHDKLVELLPGSLAIAINNGKSCVVSGREQEVNAFNTYLLSERIIAYEIPATHPLHSFWLSEIKDEFVAFLSKIKWSEPKIPMISNVTGTWLDEAQLRDGQYWANHLCNPVEFDSGLKNITAIKSSVFLEIGARKAISMLIYRYIDNPKGRIFDLIPSTWASGNDIVFFYKKLIELYFLGIDVDFSRLKQS